MYKKLLSFTGLLLVCAVSATAQVKDTFYTQNKINGVWVNNSVNVTIYDAECIAVSSEYYNWDTLTNSYKKSFRSTTRYDSGGIYSGSLTEAWDMNAGAWVNNSLYTLTYENDGKSIIGTTQIWDLVNNVWLNSFRFITNLDDNGAPAFFEFDLYDGSQWVPGSKSVYTYENNYLVKELQQSWNGTEWINNYLRRSSRNANGEKGGSLGYYWDSYNHVWINSQREKDEYLAGTDYLEKVLSQYWNGIEWVNSYQSETNYNSDNKAVNGFSEIWDANTQRWVNSFRQKSRYYPNGAQSDFIYESWDTYTSTWNYGFRGTNTNSECYTAAFTSPVVTDDEKSSDFASLINAYNKIAAKDKSNYSITLNPLATNNIHVVYDIAYKLQDGKKASYQLIIPVKKAGNKVAAVASNNTVTAKSSSFAISPNPAKNYFNVTISQNTSSNATLRLTDLSGRTVMQKKLQSAGVQRIDIPSLQKGMYIVTITSGNEVQTQKLVVE